MKRRTAIWISFGINIAIVILEIIALIMSIHDSGWNLFVYYTQDSNLFLMVASFLFCIFEIPQLRCDRKIPEWLVIFKYLATCCVTMTFVVVLLALGPMYNWQYGWLLFHGTMLYMHTLCPILAIISFIFFERQTKITQKQTYYALIPTLIYAVIIITLNITKNVYGPYPFLHLYEQSVYTSIIWTIVMMGGAYLLAWLLKLLQNKAIK